MSSLKLRFLAVQQSVSEISDLSSTVIRSSSSVTAPRLGTVVDLVLESVVDLVLDSWDSKFEFLEFPMSY